MISLIAVVGAGGAIGPENALPDFADPAEQLALAHRASKVTEGGVIVIGSNTMKMMAQAGIKIDIIGRSGFQHAIWTRQHGISPAAFLYNLTSTGKSVFICGGKTTFKVFAPFCENFFIWRADLCSAPDNLLDPILPNWQDRPVIKPAPMRMQ